MDDLPVEVIRSSRRKKTVSGSFANGRIEVRVPEGLEPEEESRLVAEMKAKVGRKVASNMIDLDRRSRALATQLGLPAPSSITWSDRQLRRWGSCTPSQGRIRISARLADVPPWVLDSVLVHELAHLVESDHGPRFQALVDRYELTERATGYLMAFDRFGMAPTTSTSGSSESG